MNAKFDELVEKRKKWVESSKENGFDYESILVGLYNDPSHFIYELLQNAEDEGATEVRFELFKDRLDFYHNGKDFHIEDINGVTGIGISKKKDDLNFIGKFGVGFKSVFAITETPYIFSGKYKIKIKDLVVPVYADNNGKKIDETLIRLPFNHRKRSPEEIFELTSRRLENLNLKTMLFLRNIGEIQWETPSKSGHYLKESKWIRPNKVRKVTVISSTETEEHLIIEKPIKIEGKTLKVEVAYKLGKDKSGKEIIIPEPDSKLVVYFPTEKVTYLNFLIQGPYKTTPSRENIPLEDEQNKLILEQTADLVGESLSVIKELGYLDVNFLNVLPIRPENKQKELIYSVVYDKVKEKLSTEELLPTWDNKYAKANEILLARGKELTEFLDNDDINLLFGKKYWLDTNITRDKTPELRNYLTKELDITEVDFESFARKITAEFLERKSDEWMINFYTKLLDQPALWDDKSYQKGILRTKPIIRLENGKHIAPYDKDGKIQVYLPKEAETKYKTVKRSLVNNKSALEFLQELGLGKPGLLAEIKEFIIPKYKRENPTKDKEYLEDFAKLLRAYKRLPEEKRKELMKELSNIAFIEAVKSDTKETSLRKPSEIYLQNNDLIEYFEGYPVWFVSNELYEKFGQELKIFLKEVGAEDKPRRIEIPGSLTLEEKSKLRGEIQHTGDTYQKDYELDGLESFLKETRPHKSFLLWNLLLNSIKTLNTEEAQKFFEGRYKWWRFQDYYEKGFDAKFLKVLKKHAWLVDKDNNLRKPSEITFSELSDSYKRNNPNIGILKEVLEFKPEIIDQLPEQQRKILEITMKHNLTPDRLEQILQKQSASQSQTKEESQEKGEEQWIPECNPEEAPKRIEDYDPEKIDVIDLTGQSENIGHENSEPLDNPKNKEARKETLDSRSIGKWGEEYVFECLKEKYQRQGDLFETDNGFMVKTSDGEDYEIVWLNKYQDKGKGCDFIIKKNGKEIEYIEVKAKTHENGELIEVTGTQWEFARSLHNKNEGNKYFFFVVTNAGKRNNVRVRKIQNPIKLWKEGKLYAHPVNFKL